MSPGIERDNSAPHILPEPYKRTEASYVELLISLIANGYTESQLLRALQNLGLPYLLLYLFGQ